LFCTWKDELGLKMKLLDTIALQQFPKVGKKTAREIVSKISTEIHNPNDWKSVFDQLSCEGLRLPLLKQEDIDAAYHEAFDIIERSEKHDIEIIHFQSEHYPLLLNGLTDAPLIVYSQGNRAALQRKSVAIIGTREPTEYGFRIGKRLSKIFAEEHYVVVSGLARGCDTAAHEGCLEAKGQTVAVLPGGLDKIYPKENEQLAKNILENDGCLVSEYPVGRRPHTGNFVERDRIQSGLSHGVIVIETDIKGGTLHTVNFAQQQKRVVACISDHPEKYVAHPKIQGNKKLLKEGIAEPIGKLNDILSFIKSMDKSLPSVLKDIINSPVYQTTKSFANLLEIQKSIPPLYAGSPIDFGIISSINALTKGMGAISTIISMNEKANNFFEAQRKADAILASQRGLHIGLGLGMLFNLQKIKIDNLHNLKLDILKDNE
jgi:DNA processing protein